MLRFRWLVSATLIALVAIVVACSGSSSTSGIPPITGIVVRAETLTTGRGCGPGPTQLFKYAAVVYSFNTDTKKFDQVVTGGLYDCFADGTFVELKPVDPAGGFTFELEVFGFTQAAYAAQKPVIDAAGSDAVKLRAASPTWTTTCTATQQQDVQSLAVCAPLVEVNPPEAQIVLATGAFPRADGGTATCGRTSGDAGVDAGADADTDAGEDAGDDAGEDAGADGGTAGPSLSFLSVRVRASLGGAEVVPQTELPCPEAFVLRNAVPSGSYTLAVELLDGSGTAVGTTTCTAVATAGVQTAATCAPVQ